MHGLLEGLQERASTLEVAVEQGVLGDEREPPRSRERAEGRSRASLHSLHSRVVGGRVTAGGSVGKGALRRLPVTFGPASIPDGVTLKSATRAEFARSLWFGCHAVATVLGTVADSKCRYALPGAPRRGARTSRSSSPTSVRVARG
jgi:hypothetical protein